MMNSKYYTPKFYLDSATHKLQVFKQFFTVKILLFALSIVSVSTGYAQQGVSNLMAVQHAATSAIQNAAATAVSAFEIAQMRTAEFEGGYQADRNDNGNWTGGRKGKGRLVGTKFGISAPLLGAYLGHTPSVSDMKNLLFETAKNVYHKFYWEKIKGDEIKDVEAATQIYDVAVNMGTGTAIMLTQRSLGLPETKVMDDATLNALNQTN
jgi:hypothetical protein